jgi:hypothetical protein
MPFIRLSDEYDEHPKVTALSDGAFRLWHQALAYSRRFETDGIVPLVIVKARQSFTTARMTELLRPWKAGENPLWHRQGDDIVIHDYLVWNHSKAEAREAREAANVRMNRHRDRKRNALGDASQDVLSNASPTVCVPGTGMDLLEEKESASPPVVAERRDVPDRRFVPRRLGRGVFEGQLPSDHLDHAVCSPNLSWCVPNPVHARLVTALSPKHGGDRAKADSALKEWYPTVFAALPADTVIADDFKFWRGHAAAVFGSKTPDAASGAAVSNKPRGCRHVPQCADDAAHTKLDMAERRRAI